ncbi:MAG: hypothetical protein AAGC88_08725 [Bacteroidota bacterium]
MQQFIQHFMRHFMRTILLFTIVAISQLANAQEKRAINPTKSVGKVKLEGQKVYTYHALSEQYRTVYKVTGPGKLYINVRVRIEDGAFKSDPFRIRHIRSGSYVEGVLVPELLAGNLKIQNKTLSGVPTRAHEVVIDVPPGKHEYEFYKDKTDQKVHIRAFYEAYPVPSWYDVEPLVMLKEKPIRYVDSGTKRDYYSITRQDKFLFDAHGPLDMRVILRPEFSYAMLDETNLKIKLENLDTGESKVYKVNARRSSKIEFVEDTRNTPGTSSTFYIDLDLPSNTTTSYAMSVVGGAKAALVRLSSDQRLIQ